MRLLNTTNKKQSIVLGLSVLVNLCLLAFCIDLLSDLKKTYTDYRYFRALPIGTSSATDSSPTENSIVLFGDSRIENWQPQPSTEKYTYINAGVTGETTSEMRRRFERDVIKLKPEYVLIQAGVNDLTAAVTKGIENPQLLIDTMHSNMRFFIETLESNNIEVIVTSILPVTGFSVKTRLLWNDTLTDEVKIANTMFKETTLSLGADWLDLDPHYTDVAGKTLKDLYYDELHLITPIGYEIMNEALMDFMDKL